MVIELGQYEREFMENAGTRLHEVVPPAPYDRPDAPYPTQISDDEENIELKFKKGYDTRPLQARLGRYVMLGACGHLKTSKKGWEYCGAFLDPMRPGACRIFEEGGEYCSKIRQIKGVDPMSPELEAELAPLQDQ